MTTSHSTMQLSQVASRKLAANIRSSARDGQDPAAIYQDQRWFALWCRTTTVARRKFITIQ